MRSLNSCIWYKPIRTPTSCSAWGAGHPTALRPLAEPWKQDARQALATARDGAATQGQPGRERVRLYGEVD